MLSPFHGLVIGANHIKPFHKTIKSYFVALAQFANLGVTHETAVSAAFQDLLQHCACQAGWPLVPEHAVNPAANGASSSTARTGSPGD